MAVIDPLKITLTNLLKDEVIETPLFPKNLDAGKRSVILGKTIYIERKDFREVDDPDFFGLAPGKEVGLKYAGLMKCEKVLKDKNGEIIELECSYNNDNRKVKGRLHWISNKDSVRSVVNIYDYLFNVDEISVENYLQDLNPKSLIVMENAMVHHSVANDKLKESTHFQFERVGYFVVDKDTNVKEDKYVFNLTVNC